MNIKQIVIDELIRRHWSRYRLAEECKKRGLSVSTVYCWLNGQNDSLGSDALGTLLEVLEIELKGK